MWSLAAPPVHHRFEVAGNGDGRPVQDVAADTDRGDRRQLRQPPDRLQWRDPQLQRRRSISRACGKVG